MYQSDFFIFLSLSIFFQRCVHRVIINAMSLSSHNVNWTHRYTTLISLSDSPNVMPSSPSVSYVYVSKSAHTMSSCNYINSSFMLFSYCLWIIPFPWLVSKGCNSCMSSCKTSYCLCIAVHRHDYSFIIYLLLSFCFLSVFFLAFMLFCYSPSFFKLSIFLSVYFFLPFSHVT